MNDSPFDRLRVNGILDIVKLKKRLLDIDLL
jgi:hypothetical protein